MPRGEEGILKEGPSEEEDNQDNERHNFATLYSRLSPICSRVFVLWFADPELMSETPFLGILEFLMTL